MMGCFMFLKYMYCFFWIIEKKFEIFFYSLLNKIEGLLIFVFIGVLYEGLLYLIIWLKELNIF